MTIDLDTIERLARAATPGPWPIAMTSADNRDMGHARGPEHPRPDRMSWHPQTEIDAAYIAAVSPDVVLEMVARLRKAEAVCKAIEHEDVHNNASLQDYWKVWRRAVEATKP